MPSDPIDLEDITVDLFDHQQELVDAQRKEDRLHDLTRRELKRLGHDYITAKLHLGALEDQCRSRALRARLLGFSDEDIADSFSIRVETVQEWLGEVT